MSTANNMLIDKTEAKYLVLAVLERKVGTKTEKSVLKKFIHRANYAGPYPERTLGLTKVECKTLYDRMLSREFINRDFYAELSAIIKKIREFSEEGE